MPNFKVLNSDIAIQCLIGFLAFKLFLNMVYLLLNVDDEDVKFFFVISQQSHTATNRPQRILLGKIVGKYQTNLRSL